MQLYSYKRKGDYVVTNEELKEKLGVGGYSAEDLSEASGPLVGIGLIGTLLFSLLPTKGLWAFLKCFLMIGSFVISVFGGIAIAEDRITRKINENYPFVGSSDYKFRYTGSSDYKFRYTDYKDDDGIKEESEDGNNE